MTCNQAPTIDCYDGNANARPGQTSFFGSNRGDGSFDYNCDGIQEHYLTTVSTCYETFGFGQTVGWRNLDPSCGVTNDYTFVDQSENGNCSFGWTSTVQQCR